MDRPAGLLYVGVFAIALMTGAFLTPAARRLALRIGVLDRPRDGTAQVGPVALLGGLALYGGAFAAAWLAVPGARSELTGLFLTGLVVLVFGLWDDVVPMGPGVKLLAQTTSALVLVTFGVQIRLVAVPAVDVGLTVLWVVTVLNAMNLQDNMNGLAAGLAAVSCLGVFVLALGEGQGAVAIAAVGMAGGAIGFLPSNWPRARIFMGDAGSMFLGLVLAFLTLRLPFFTWPRPSSFAIPLLVLAVPLFDTALVTVSRLRRGVPVTQGGLDHSSHRLVGLGLSPPVAVALLWSAQGVCCIAALAVTRLGHPFDTGTVVLAVTAAGAGAVVLSRAFPLTTQGHPEPGRSTTSILPLGLVLGRGDVRPGSHHRGGRPRRRGCRRDRRWAASR